MLMRAGMSYSDWRLMARFQRRDFLARRTIEQSEMKNRLEGAESVGEMLSLAFVKLMGF